MVFNVTVPRAAMLSCPESMAEKVANVAAVFTTMLAQTKHQGRMRGQLAGPAKEAAGAAAQINHVNNLETSLPNPAVDGTSHPFDILKSFRLFHLASRVGRLDHQASASFCDLALGREILKYLNKCPPPPNVVKTCLAPFASRIIDVYPLHFTTNGMYSQPQ